MFEVKKCYNYIKIEVLSVTIKNWGKELYIYVLKDTYKNFKRFLNNTNH